MKIQSNGMGMQSVAMYLMSSMGILPRFDYSIFADTGKEKKETYKYLKWLKEWQKKNNGIPLIHDTSKNLYKDLLNNTNSTNNRFSSIPAFTKNPDGSIGMLRRQCTNEYKIEVVLKNIRELLGLNKGQSYKKTVKMFIGISIDEIHRVSNPRRKNIEFHYPFSNIIASKNKTKRGDYEIKSRSNIKNWLLENDFNIPVKSSCIFCPFQHNKNWLDMKRNSPKEFNECVELDKKIRNSSKKGFEQPIYLHRSATPLDQANLNEEQLELNFDCMGFCDI